MPLRKWSLVAAPIALLAGPALAQSPPPAIPVAPVGTAPPPSQPVSAVAPPMPKAPVAPVPPPSVAQAPGVPAPGVPAPAVPVAAAGAPGAPGAPRPPGASPIPPLPSLLAPAEPKIVRTVGADEVEIPRGEYKARLLACISYSSQCKLAGLTPQDRDYIRYELRGQRYDTTVTADIAQMRMRQFTNDTSPDVIVPKLPEGAHSAPIERVTTIENRSNAEGYGLAVTIPHRDARSGGLPIGTKRHARPAGQAQAPDWW